MTRRPSPAAALANGANLYLMRTGAVRVVQISTDWIGQFVLAFSQFKAYIDAFSTGSTDVFGLVSRVDFRAVSAGRVSLNAWCDAHMEKRVLLVLPHPVANLPRQSVVLDSTRP
ncbi:hypothetical protein I5G80_gp072 [Mycobacterium phage Krueger]|uniref:Uncharacterized protein n=1 Tax=Mycobacterium phage Krueger TaxID=2015820 RepID=A0A222ZMI6_9CAUD|nr:hypothetical protein I5G80_gp072 [Mycobacterium phage Krueger]ASR85599.1 hypothetical protein SEA_KRUEGER_74 [Mycobacterium phage Krueger]